MVLTGREKATIFLSILGAETAGRILRYLPDELADLIAAGINHLPSPSPDALSEVMDEFKSYIALPAGEGAPRISRLTPPKPRKNFSFLMYERPQMAAFLLSALPRNEQEEILLSLPREKAVILTLIDDLKTNPLTPKIRQKLNEMYKDKLNGPN